MIKENPPSESQATVTVIIVNWNSGLLLRSCIESMVGTVALEIIAVDNASTDGSEMVASTHPRVTLIRAAENLGFGKACNLGARQARGEYLLFLNPDAALFPGTLEKALDFMQHPANARVGICGVQLVDESGGVARSCARFPSPMDFVAHAMGIDRVFPQWGHRMAEWAHDQTRDVDHVIGAFFLIRRSLFQKLGGFDERFFVYLEDLDLSLRASQLGWRCVYLANVKTFHAGGGTSQQIKARRLFYSLSSRFLYAAKHFSLSGAAVVFFATLLVEPMSRSALALARCSWPAFKETWQGYAMLWRWLPRWMIKSVMR